MMPAVSDNLDEEEEEKVVLGESVQLGLGVVQLGLGVEEVKK